MAVTARCMAQIIREGMDDYWRVVYSKTDEGLTDNELKTKRDWEKDMARLDQKFGKQFGRSYTSHTSPLQLCSDSAKGAS